MAQASRFRERPPAPPRLVTPIDPTLASRSVPHRRDFIGRSFSQGALLTTITRPLYQVEKLADPATYYEGAEFYLATQDGVRELLRAIDEKQSLDNDPTWGFYVFVTAYSSIAQDRLPQAIRNWVKLIEHSLRYLTLSVFTEEAARRLKLSVVENRDALEGASDDSIRAEFEALLRDKKLRREEADDGRSVFRLLAENMVCFVLDEDTIGILANLSIPERDDNPSQFYQQFETVTVKEYKAWRIFIR
ncbi:hypothetical protein BDV59DRAFT_199662 [Aspergillus ambiguus]|uniref:uncharacterized protein n=1 Tax=Aspergillus ambiguus TaxID=176160 RepID=UPI003CCCFE12